jgi:hypothetical protein
LGLSKLEKEEEINKVYEEIKEEVKKKNLFISHARL